MPDQIKRMDVLHEAAFSEPSFVLLREFPPVIKKFYEVLSTRFSVSPAYTTINSTNTVADLTIRIGLFNNSAAIELRPDRMAVSLPNITSRDELIVVKDTLSLAHNALKGALPETTLSTSKLTLNTWISLEGGAALLRTSSRAVLRHRIRWTLQSGEQRLHEIAFGSLAVTTQRGGI